MGDFNTTTLEVAPGRTQGMPRRFARSKIRKVGRLLYDTVRHTATRS
jgi:hypothetical protein